MPLYDYECDRCGRVAQDLERHDAPTSRPCRAPGIGGPVSNPEEWTLTTCAGTLYRRFPRPALIRVDVSKYDPVLDGKDRRAARGTSRDRMKRAVQEAGEAGWENPFTNG